MNVVGVSLAFIFLIRFLYEFDSSVNVSLEEIGPGEMLVDFVVGLVVV